MTKTLIHKLSRHSEYYALDTVFDDLYHKSKQNSNFVHLYDRIFSHKNICLAFRNIKSNKGSMTPGLHRLGINKVKRMSLDQVVSTIQTMAKDYKPNMVKRIFIPKPNGKQRPIGIPTIMDRLFQQCVKQVIEPICEAKFHAHSYGFRPNRSAKHALARSAFLININQLHYVVDIDIRAFFDTIDHGKLLKQCWTLGIRDKKILSLLSKMLKAEIQGEGIPTKGTPQGGILSPLLSNICLNELDWWLSSQWATFPVKFPYKTKSQADKVLRNKSNLKEFHAVRYADDFKIFCRDYETAKNIYIATQKWLKERLNLEASPEKSSITNLRKKNSPFLGILLRARPNKNGNNKLSCRSKVQPKALENMKLLLKSIIVKVQRNPSSENVKRFNSTVMGLQNYYSCATDCTTDFYKLGFMLSRTIHNRLNRLFSKTGFISKTYSKRYKWKSLPNFIKGFALFPISEIRHKKLYQFTQIMTPYTSEGRALMHKELDSLLKVDLSLIGNTYSREQSIEFNDNRISRWSAQKGKCSVTKEYLGINFHCHHIVPRSKGGTDKYSNLVIISSEIHKLIHAVAPWLIVQLLENLKLNKRSLEKVNQFREKVGLNHIK